MTAVEIVLLVLLGAGVGLFGTLVGAGGGFILTPVLLLLYPAESPATITAVSLLAVFANAASGSIAYARQRRIDIRSGAIFAAAALPGAVAGALAVQLAPRRLFAVIMAVLLFGLALWLLLRPRPSTHEPGSGTGVLRTITDRSGTVHRYRARTGLGALLSVAVGFLSSFLGIGGGVVHVPVLITVLGFPVHVATATSHFVLSITAFAGTATHLAAGDLAGVMLARAVLIGVGAVAGAQAGARLSQRLAGHHIERLLAAALAVLAVRLAISAL